MRRLYTHRKLSESEQLELEQLLLELLDTQRWYAIAYATPLSIEILIPLN